MKYRVPGHLIPSKCPLCRREIVRLPQGEGMVSILIDYSTIKEVSKNSTLFHGTEHDCPIARRSQIQGDVAGRNMNSLFG